MTNRVVISNAVIFGLIDVPNHSERAFFERGLLVNPIVSGLLQHLFDTTSIVSPVLEKGRARHLVVCF